MSQYSIRRRWRNVYYVSPIKCTKCKKILASTHPEQWLAPSVPYSKHILSERMADRKVDGEVWEGVKYTIGSFLSWLRFSLEKQI